MNITKRFEIIIQFNLHCHEIVLIKSTWKLFSASRNQESFNSFEQPNLISELES